MNRIINLPANYTTAHVYDTVLLPKDKTPKKLELFARVNKGPDGNPLDAYPLKDGAIGKKFGVMGVSAQYDWNATIAMLDDVLGNSEFKCEACGWCGVPSLVECQACPKCKVKNPTWTPHRDNRCQLCLLLNNKPALPLFLRQIPVAPLKSEDAGSLPCSAAYFRFITPGTAWIIKPKEKIKIVLSWPVRPPFIKQDMLLRVGLVGAFYE
jgi:hypothetical protein